MSIRSILVLVSISSVFAGCDLLDEAAGKSASNGSDDSSDADDTIEADDTSEGDDSGDAAELPEDGVWYRLQTEFQGPDKCLEGNQAASAVKEGAAFMDDCADVTGQLFRFEADAETGAWRLKTMFQGVDKCLEGNASDSEVHGGAAFMDNCQEVSGQLWEVVPDGEHVRLQTLFGGQERCLEGNQAGSEVHQGAAFMDSCAEVTGQLWTLVPTDFVEDYRPNPDPGLVYRLRTDLQGHDRCLEGNQADSEVMGGNAFMDDCAEVSGQLWRFEPDGEHYRMKTLFQGEDKCLEGNQADSDYHDGAAFMDDCSAASGQLWDIVPDGQGLRLKTVFRGDSECLEGNDADSEVHGGTAFMDDCQAVTGQSWSLEAVAELD